MKINTLYKYRHFDDSDHNVANVKNDQIYASRINELNDPFEMLFDSTRHKQELKLLDKIFKGKTKSIDEQLQAIIVMRNSMGQYSLSSSWNNEIMWSHYANCHTGFCIEYDVEYLKRFYHNKSYLIEIKYKNSLPTMSLVNLLKNDARYMVELLHGVKSTAWEYEKEKRIVFDESGLLNYDVRALKSIIIGANASENDVNKLMNALDGKAVKVYKAAVRDDRFEICKNLVIELDAPAKVSITKEAVMSNLDEYGYFKYENDDKNLLGEALVYVLKDPYLDKIQDCCFSINTKRPTVVINATVKNDYRPVVQIKIDKEFLKNNA